MMEAILVLTHVDDSGAELTKASLEAVTAGVELSRQMSSRLVIGVLGLQAGAAASALASTGARLIAVSGEAFAQARYATDAAGCEALCRAANASIVLAPASTRFARVAAGVAHRLGGFIDTHITDMRIASGGVIEVSRWFYRQRIEASITREARPWFLLLDSGTNAAYAGEAGPAQVETLSITLSASRTVVEGYRSPAGDGQTIRPDARLLFVAGAGWTKKQTDGQIHVSEAGQQILSFLRLSGASLGSSKSLADQKADGSGEGQPVLPFLTHLNQIGQTGSTPHHPKGLSTCCHGEEPHTVGWRFVGERRAISLDANCGWTRGKADVVYVADAFQVMSRVNATLEARNSAKTSGE